MERRCEREARPPQGGSPRRPATPPAHPRAPHLATPAPTSPPAPPQVDMQSKSQAELLAAAQPDAAAVAAALRKLAAAVEAHPVELVSPAVEAMAADFLMQ